MKILEHEFKTLFIYWWFSINLDLTCIGLFVPIKKKMYWFVCACLAFQTFFVIRQVKQYIKRCLAKRRTKKYMECIQGLHKARTKKRTKNTPSPYLQPNQSTKSTINMDTFSKPPLIHSKKIIRKTVLSSWFESSTLSKSLWFLSLFVFLFNSFFLF